MSREERLFDAIGGVDDALLARSEKKKKQTPWLGWGVGLAACLAVVLTVAWVLPGAFREEPPPVTASDDLPSGYAPTQEDPDDPGPGCTLPSEPWPPEEGEVHYLQVRLAPEEPELRFRIYINKEIYYSYEREGVYTIRPRQEAEGIPECRLEISYMADIALDEALEQVRNSLTGLYAEIEELPGPPNGWYAVNEETERFLFASNGTDWDSAQREVLLEDDREGGVFVLSASYFMEATEGHGARFADMMRTFAPASDLWQIVWMAQLRYAEERLSEAVFTGDLAGVEDILTPDAEAFVYDEDVSDTVSVASVDYSLPNSGNQTASVSVKHRLGGEDAYQYLNMELEYLDGEWKAAWIGLEK